MSDVLEQVEARLQQTLESVRVQNEANEKLLAELLMGYQELTVVVQVLLHKLYGDSIEETEDFKKKLDSERKRMFEWIKNGAAAMAVSEQDLTDALEQLLPQSVSKSD